VGRERLELSISAGFSLDSLLGDPRILIESCL
jgi:hypothetical protein